jgi:hypothetical protein
VNSVICVSSVIEQVHELDRGAECVSDCAAQHAAVRGRRVFAFDRAVTGT